VKVEEDAGTRALLEADTPVCTIFGKSWLLHVLDVLRTTPEENLAMIADTVRCLKRHGKEVIYDAEHFFDGYKSDAAYALSTLKAAREAGADVIVLCDTNGGTLPEDVARIAGEVRTAVGDPIGIHAHNDSDLATANSLAAVRAGAVHVQGTINGFGERVGNANLCAIVPNLMLKMGLECLPSPESLRQMTDVSLYVYEAADLRPFPKQAYVGQSAFAHKAGMHVDGVRKNRKSFEHVEPESVGNQRRILVSELSGASNVFLKVVEMGLDVDRNSAEVKAILHELERMEKSGYEFEAAEASFKLLIQKVLKKHKSFFQLEGFRVIVEKREPGGPCISEATLKINVMGQTTHTVGEGDGPVDALNNALRKALEPFYPAVKDVKLTDYSVRILDPQEATAAKTRVLIESADKAGTWSTVGVSGNIIEASWEALVDGVEYKLFREEARGAKD
jgi:2-isopropylmalate synthase